MTTARRLRPITAAALALALSLLALAPMASAHTALVSASPADGSTVTEQPGQVVLTFNEALQEQFAQVAVADANGSPYQTGEPQASGTTVTQTVGELPDGTYTVSFRVVSADGHPVTGSYQFSVAAAAPPTTPSTTGTASGTAPAATPSSTSDSAPSDSVPSESSTPVAAGTGADDGGLGPGAITALAVAAVAVLAGLGYFAIGGRRRTVADSGDTTEGTDVP